MANNNIKNNNKELPKHDGLNMTGGSPAVTASLEELLKSLSDGIATAMASYYTGNYNAGTDMKKLSTNGAKNNKERSILGSKDSLYFYVKGIHSILNNAFNKENINKIIN